MKMEVFAKAINQFDKGIMEFNLGTKWSFLFNNKWYPTHAFMKAYYQQQSINKEYNLHQSVFELSKFMSVISAEKTYFNCLPIENN